MIQLIDDIIQLSRLDEDAPLDGELPVDLFDTAHDVIDRLRDHAEGKRHQPVSGWRSLRDHRKPGSL